MRTDKEIQEWAASQLMSGLLETTKMVDINTGKVVYQSSGNYPLNKGDYFHHNINYDGDEVDVFYKVKTKVVVSAERIIYGVIEEEKPIWYQDI